MLHKAIKGFEDYLISDTGQVYSLKRGKYLKPKKDTRGYIFVSLYKNGDGVNKRVHRLVAQAFIPNPNNFEHVDHIDFNRTNNNVKNLRWLGKSENVKRHQSNMPIIEIVNNKQIKYDALNAVPDIRQGILSKHISKGETDFYVKQRNGKIRHFILPQNTENSNRKEETVNWLQQKNLH